jgi:hypothetical protein
MLPVKSPDLIVAEARGCEAKGVYIKELTFPTTSTVHINYAVPVAGVFRLNRTLEKSFRLEK